VRLKLAEPPLALVYSRLVTQDHMYLSNATPVPLPSAAVLAREGEGGGTGEGKAESKAADADEMECATAAEEMGAEMLAHGALSRSLAVKARRIGGTTFDVHVVANVGPVVMKELRGADGRRVAELEHEYGCALEFDAARYAPPSCVVVCGCVCHECGGVSAVVVNELYRIVLCRILSCLLFRVSSADVVLR